MDIQTIIDIKNYIDENKITDTTDLTMFYLSTERLDIYALLRVVPIKEIFDAYIEKKNSEYNKMLIKKYYNDLLDSLI